MGVAYFSIEMPSDENYERLLSPIVKMSGDDFRRKEMVASNAKIILDGMEEVNKNHIWMSDDRVITVPSIRSQTKRLMAERDIKLIIVDYLGLVKPTGKFATRKDEVTSVSNGLREIAYDLDLSVLALHQLNRECESRTDKRPILSDLRESGDIEQDVHIAMFLYRDHVYHEEADRQEAELIIRKNRGGKIGRIKLTFEGQYTEFRDYEEPLSVSTDKQWDKDL